LQSIASRNDEAALETLEGFGLREFFLVPQFGSTAKSASISRIAERLGISLRSIAFIDDEPYERAEVMAVHQDVLCVDAAEVAPLLSRTDLVIPEGTGPNRRKLHLAELSRQSAEEATGGPSEAFLRSLEMSAVVRRAEARDMARIRELMLRTNQLNSTGRYHPEEELERLCAADDSLPLVVDVADRFGDSGTVGFALTRVSARHWTITMLMVSCRVRDRGVGAAILGGLQRGAERAGARLRADFVRTPANRQMFVALKLAGFTVVEAKEPELLLEADPSVRQPMPAWIGVRDETGLLLP
jgi:FkbH-like protein